MAKLSPEDLATVRHRFAKRQSSDRKPINQTKPQLLGVVNGFDGKVEGMINSIGPDLNDRDALLMLQMIITRRLEVIDA